MILVVIVVFFVFTIYGCWYNSPKQKGKRGEIWVHEILLQLPEEYHVFSDMVLETGNRTTQIDHVVVSKYGIFAIETKNYQGDIYGNDMRKEWTQLIVTDKTYRNGRTYTYVTKNRFYNPVKQTLGHVYKIRSFLTDWPYLKVVPIVVFAGSANIDSVSSKNHVIYDTELLDIIRGYKAIYLTETEVVSICNIFSQKNVRTFVDDETHMRNLESAKRDTIFSGICPKCGGPLIEREGRYGSFYGCSNYPKCKYTIQ
ncbi:MAG: NERD domain-containing protein [Prevotella sp.]|nr:NERD domain-containing protein [Prevotella sp.]